MAQDKQSVLVSPVGTLSFPSLANPVSEEYGGKFKAELLVDISVKENKKAIDRLVAAAEAAFKKAYPKKSFERFLEDKTSPILMPGSPIHEEMVEEGKIKEDVVRLRFSNSRRPFLRLPDTSLCTDKQEIEDEFYAGAKARVAATLYSWGGGYIGVSLSMQSVQKVGEGKRLGAGLTDYEFDELEVPYDDEDSDDDDTPKKSSKKHDDDDTPKKSSKKHDDDDDEDEI